MCHQLVQPKLTFTLQHAMFSVKVGQKLPSELMFAFCALPSFVIARLNRKIMQKKASSLCKR